MIKTILFSDNPAPILNTQPWGISMKHLANAQTRLGLVKKQ
jgi:hypothetical protein